YDQFMALKAPVDYWGKKKDQHKGRVGLLKNWALGVGIFGAVGLLISIHHVFSDNAITYWKIGVFVLLATLYFWALRILIKLLLSNIHLEGDADERVVMAQTYLALLRDQSGL